MKITFSYAKLRELTDLSTKSLNRLFKKYGVKTYRKSNQRFVYLLDLQKIPSFGESIMLLFRCRCSHSSNCILHTENLALSPKLFLSDEDRAEVESEEIK
jgi:hypothetical protein